MNQTPVRSAVQPRVWSTRAFPKAQRFDAWCEMLSTSHAPVAWDVPSRSSLSFDGDCFGQIREATCGELRLSECETGPLIGVRSRREVRMSRTEHMYGIETVLNGWQRTRSRGTEFVVRPGQFLIWNTSEAVESHIPETLHKLTLIVPESVLKRYIPRPDDIAWRTIDGSAGLGALFIAHMRALAAEMQAITPDDGAVVMRTAVELACAAARQGVTESSRDVVRNALRRRVREEIDRSLADPDLSPELVAARVGISPRYLHKLFEDDETSVCAFIKAQRLDRCRVDIELSVRTGRTITDIALGWGFANSAHFSREFRAKFGCAPSEYLKSAREAFSRGG